MKGIPRVLWLVLPLVLAIPGGGERVTAASKLQAVPGKFSCELDVGNNLWRPDELYSFSLWEGIPAVKNIPSTILGREIRDLRLPVGCGDKREWGLSYRKVDWVRVTGESLEFYLDALEGTEPRRYYDLRLHRQNYSRAGLYLLHRWKQAGIDFVLRGDLFLCPDYVEWDATGQGRLKTKLGSPQVQVYGFYRQTWTEEGASPGIGAALTWEARMAWEQGAGLELRVGNLPGWVYFPGLTVEIGKVDSEQESLGPVHVDGKKTRETRRVNLSPEATAVLFYPAGPGRLQFTAAGTGMVGEFTAGYYYDWQDKHTLLAKINPVMNHLVLGWAWHWGEICLYLDYFEPALVKGVKISFWK